MAPLTYAALRMTYQTDGHMARDLFRQIVGLQRELQFLDELTARLEKKVDSLLAQQVDRKA